MRLANEIVELFEDLLGQKGIEIPCEDKEEQKERYYDGNEAKLYGMEYWNLVSKIENLLTDTSCRILTFMGDVDGKLLLNKNGKLVAISEAFDEYLEEYSME